MGNKTEAEIERVKRRLNEAEYNRDFCIKQLIMAVEEVDKYKEIRTEERKVRREQEKRNGGLSVGDNKWILLLGIVLILIGLAGIKF